MKRHEKKENKRKKRRKKKKKIKKWDGKEKRKEINRRTRVESYDERKDK